MMINGSFSLKRAEKLADRVKQDEYPSAKNAIRYLIRLVWCRNATKEEVDTTLEFLGCEPNETTETINKEKLIDFCHVLLNSSEFLYVD